MTLTVPDTLFDATRMSEQEILQELAIVLYKKEKLSIGQASQLAQMGRIQFQNFLASRMIPINYDVEDFEADIETLKRLGRI